VWDWENSTWYNSELTPGTDYKTTFHQLEAHILGNPEDQRITNNNLIMQIEAQDED